MNWRIILLPILVMVLAGCGLGSGAPAQATPVVANTETATATHMPPATATPVPPTPTAPATLTATPTATSTPAPTATEKTCLALISPPNEEWIRAYGNQTFEWEPWPGALSYLLQISVPNGWTMSVDLQKTSQSRYMQSLPAEGTYVWKVTALDANGEPICCSAPFTFRKQGSTASLGGGGETSTDINFTGG